MPDNNEIFLEFWRTYQWPKAEPLYFRLYHDSEGKPICYSRHDQPGEFVEVTPEEFAVARMDVRVRDGKLTYPPKPSPPKLVPSSDGTACHVQDITVIVDANDTNQRWKLRT